LGGHVVQTDGPAGGGEAALVKALSWPDVTLSFDENAEPSFDEITMSNPIDDQGPSDATVVPRLSEDPQVARLGRASLRSSLLFFTVPIALILVAVLALVIKSSAVLILAAVIALILFLLLAVHWSSLFVRFRIVFLRDAINVPGGLPRAVMPQLVEASPGVIRGKPHLVVRMQTRCMIGKVGRCRIELFSDGLQIWKGPQYPELRWQFSYRDLLQAECVDVVTPAAAMAGSPDQYLVRLIANQPRMAFLFGSVWFGTAGGQNRSARLLINELRRHNVPVFDEILES